MSLFKRYPWLEHLLVLAYFALLTVLFTYPLVFNLGTSLLASPVTTSTGLAHPLVRQSFLQRQLAPLLQPLDELPGWLEPLDHRNLPGHCPAGGAGQSLVKSIAGYNVACLLTFVLSGYFMYLSGAARQRFTCHGADRRDDIRFHPMAHGAIPRRTSQPDRHAMVPALLLGAL